MELENASQKYSWVEVYGEGVKAVLVEDSIVWASRSDSAATSGSSASSWPALVSAQLKCWDCDVFKSVAEAVISDLHVIYDIFDFFLCNFSRLLHPLSRLS